MADSTKRYVLDLSTVEPERPLIRIDGQSYELAVLSDFGLLQRARLQRLQRQLQELANDQATSDDVDEASVQALLDVLDLIVAMVAPGLPDEVRNRLNEGQKVAIVQAFSRAAGMAAPTNPAPPPKRQKSTGERSSRVSSGSTGDDRTTG